MIRLDKWAGLVTNASQYAIPPGATVEQVNVQCLVPGQLTVRAGMQALTMPVQPSGSQAIVSAVRYQHGTDEHIVYQNDAGEIYSSQVQASALATGAPPTSPSIVSALPAILGIQVTASQPVSSGSAPITGYVFQVSSDNKVTWTAAGASTGTTATLSNLTAGVGYYVRAAASNRYGTGSYGAPLGVVTPSAPAAARVPSAPQSVTAVAGNAMATVRWTAPSSDGGATITSYTVQASKDRGLTWSTAGTTATTSLDANGLLNQTDYIFRVSATNSAGTSAYSAASAAVTPSSSILTPSAPPNFRVSAGGGIGTDYVVLLWDVVSGMMITGYTLQYKPSAGNSWTTIDFGPDAVKSVGGLSASTSYDFRLAAVNAAGTGAYSTLTVSTSSPATIGPPSAPQSFAVDASYIAYAASWSPPATDGGAPIVKYRMERATAAAGPWTIDAEYLTTSVQKQLTLSGGVTNYFRVSAYNGTHWGQFASYSVSIKSPPSAPLNPTASLTNPFGNKVAFSWDPPSDLGGAAISRYELLATSGGVTLVTASTPGTPSGRQSLTVEVGYSQSATMTIRASNGFAVGDSASVAYTTPRYYPAPLKPLLVSSSQVNDWSLTLVLAQDPAEIQDYRNGIASGTYRWVAQYSTDNGITYKDTAFPVGAGDPTTIGGVSVPTYVGTLSPYVGAPYGGYVAEVLFRIAVSLQSPSSGTNDLTYPISPWVYKTANIAG